MEFKCSLCDAQFYKKQYLKTHLSRVHQQSAEERPKNFSCVYCEKKFSLKNTLSKHLVTVHNIRSESNLPVECQEQDCIEKFKNISHLRNHLCEKHNLENFGKSHELEFMESSEFYKWLADEEMKTNMKYVVSYTKNCSSFKSVMFCCNRSGKYKSTVDERERQLKAQGTKKMGFHCTSSILLKDYGSRLAATYFEEHYKHDAHLCHIPIPKFEKEVIAEKIMSGVQEKRILEDIRQSFDNTIERKHLITKKDFQNIKKEFGLSLQSEGSVIRNDEASVCAWVENMKTETYNPVLFFKRQDDNHDIIDKKDFMLVVMTEFQKNMLCQFGADRICVDSTHSISGYQFELVTILVVDEYEEGVPVAFCIMSTVDTKTLTHFFQCIKSTLGKSIKPQVFMSDDAVMFKNAWVNVFGSCQKYLLCAWHIDRAWKKHIQSLKKDIQGDIYKTLKTLLYELDVDKFKVMISNFCEMLKEDSNTKEFHEYFTNFYSNRTEMWAYCFRKNARLNTNMHIENFHRLLKHIYLDGKKTKRVDKVITELIKLANDKNFEHFIKALKCKITKKATENFKRHKLGKELKAHINEVKNNEWEIVSSDKKYAITKVHTCDKECIISCRNCMLCTRSYTCTCHDNAIRNYMCKHIHHLSIMLTTERKFTGPLNDYANVFSKGYLIKKNSSKKINNSLETIKMRIESLNAKVKHLTDIPDSVSDQINQHINAIEHLLQFKRSSIEQRQINSEPVNKKIVPQKRFHSVKKNTSVKKVKLSNPTSVEAASKKSILLKEEFCTNNGNFDHSYL